MSWKFLSGMRPNKESYGFVLTLLCVVGLFALAFIQKTDILGTLIAIHATFVAAKSTEKVGAYMAASKDEKCDTRMVINDLEGNRKVDNPDA